MTRPHLLLVPVLTELEWPIRPLLEEWADVAAYDAPGIGEEPPSDEPRLDATARRGLEELDRRGWQRAIVVGDEFGAVIAVRLAEMRPEAVAALVLGHFALDFGREGDRPALNAAILEAQTQMIAMDFRSFARQNVSIWDPERRPPSEHAPQAEERVERYLERIRPEVAESFVSEIAQAEERIASLIEPTLRRLDVPLLAVRHEDCLMYTAEGYEDAVAAFPGARRATTGAKPSISADFAKVLRSFCAEVFVER
jgi:pimeloyl-ACP methyl ester carboxylesterase